MRLFLLLLMIGYLLPAASAQDSLNLSATGRWEDPTLPAASGIRYNDVWGYTDSLGQEYGIVGSAGFTLFLQLDGPTGIREVARFDEGFNSIWRDYKTFGHYAYGTADQGNAGLIIYDLSALPDTVTQVYSSNEVFSRAHNLFVDEAQGRLYVAGSNTRANGVIIYDLNADPANPVLLGDPVLPAGGYIHDIFVKNHTAYCSHGTSGLAVYDLSDAAQPVTLGTLTSYPEQGYNHSSWLSEDDQLLVFADETFGRSLKAVDMANVQEMEVTDLFKSEMLAPEHTNSIAHNPFIRGQYAVVSYYHEGVQVFDLSDPNDVQRFAWYDTYPQNTDYQGFRGCWGVYPFLPSGRIIATDISNGFFILEPQGWSFDPPAPVVQATLSVAGDTLLCPGDSLQLFAASTGEGWAWEKDGQEVEGAGDTLWISTAGSYRYANNSGTFPVYSDTLNVSLAAAPTAVVPTAPAFCPGDTLTAPASGNYDLLLLSHGATGFTDSLLQGSPLLFPAPGVYFPTAFLGACRQNLDSIVVSVAAEAVAPEAQPFTPPLCEGDDLLIHIPGSGSYSYFLGQDTVALDTGLLALPADEYWISASNGQCETEFMLGETPAPLPVPELLLQDGVLACTFVSSVNYIWVFNGERVDTTAEATYPVVENGVYQVGVFNEFSCLGFSAPLEVMVNAASTEPLNTEALLFYPNPSNGLLYVQPESHVGQISLYSLSGQLLRQYDRPALPLQLAQLAQGAYIVRVKLQSGEEVRKLWHKH